MKKLQEEQKQLLELSKNRESTKTRLREFRKNLSSGEILENFDRVVFESVIYSHIHHSFPIATRFYILLPVFLTLAFALIKCRSKGKIV